MIDYSRVFLARLLMFWLQLAAMLILMMILASPVAAQEGQADTLVKVTPSAWDFGRVPVGRCDSVELTIRLVGSDSVKLEHIARLADSVSVGSDTLSFTVQPSTIDSFRTSTCIVRFCPQRIGRVSIRLVFNNSRDTADTVFVTGEGISSPLDVMQNSLNFGSSVQAGTCSDTTGFWLTVTNRYHLPITLRKPYPVKNLSDTTFKVVWPPSDSTLDPGESIFVWVRFCPPRDTCFDEMLRFEDSAFGLADTVYLSGCAAAQTVPVLSVPTTILDFGEVVVDSCKDTTLTIFNTGTATLHGDPLQTQSSIQGFSILAPNDSVRIPPDSLQTYTISFCPPDSIQYTDTLIIHTAVGDRVVTLRGIGKGGSQQQTDIEYTGTAWLDTAFQHVNERFRSHLLLSTRLDSRYGIEGFSAVVRFNTSALYPWDVVPGNAGSSFTWQYQGDSLTILYLPSTATLSGDTLFQIEFQGLVTGMPENMLELVDLKFFGGRVGVVTRRDGLVHLEGCDVGKNPYVPAKAGIDKITPSPASRNATITYTATEGAIPQVRLLDITGGGRLTIELPPGTGAQQQADIAFDGVPDGVYLLQLVVGMDMTGIPIMISR